MKINLTHTNPALTSIIKDPEQIITLDANFLIAPDRSRITKKGIGFEKFKQIWLDPIFSAFPNLAIHESVYDELVGISPQHYVDAKKIAIHLKSSSMKTPHYLRLKES